MRALPFALLALLAAQIMFWHTTREIQPSLDIVPTPPGQNAVHALALGDDEFYFRALALELQNFGDTYGRFTALRAYDFGKLYGWLTVLDTLNARSNMLPSIASYYFSQTQNTPDVRYMIDYLYTHSMRDVPHKWWWLLQAMYLSTHRLNDMDLALKVTQPMLIPEVPAWAQQMVAVIHEKRGEMEDALHIMEQIRDNATAITDADLKYMRYFIDERLKKLEETR